MKKQIKKGFTLAEVLITLTILGVVAAIAIPSVMRTQNEVAERNKIKKAIVDYEKLIPNMTIENDLTSIEALKDYANKDNCVKSRTYFKIKQDDTSETPNNCIFQTSNGVWWNITDITKPVISTKGIDNLSTADGKNSFLLTTTYSDTARAFIVDDLSTLTDPELSQVSKTLGFAKLLKASSGGEEIDEKTKLKSIFMTPCTGSNFKSCISIDVETSGRDATFSEEDIENMVNNGGNNSDYIYTLYNEKGESMSSLGQMINGEYALEGCKNIDFSTCTMCTSIITFEVTPVENCLNTAK